MGTGCLALIVLLVLSAIGLAAGGAAGYVVAAVAGVFLMFVHGSNVLSDEQMLYCPHCKKRVKMGADTCHHCGREVKPPSVERRRTHPGARSRRR
jgi:hypothetical protein